MARGNDSENARQELDSQYGDHATAEDLIKAHDYAHDPVLDAALNKPVDAARTEGLDLDSIEPREGGTVASAAVRGGVLVVVEELPNGAHAKWYDADYVKNGASKAPAAEPEEDDLSEPGKVTSDAIQAKLAELGIDKGDKTNKDGFWSLLDDDARKDLKDAVQA